jgi:hypothetical protein
LWQHQAKLQAEFGYRIPRNNQLHHNNLKYSLFAAMTSEKKYWKLRSSKHRFLSAQKSGIVTANTKDENDKYIIWSLETTSDGNYALRNVKTDKYLGSDAVGFVRCLASEVDDGERWVMEIVLDGSVRTVAFLNVLNKNYLSAQPAGDVLCNTKKKKFSEHWELIPSEAPPPKT